MSLGALQWALREHCDKQTISITENAAFKERLRNHEHIHCAVDARGVNLWCYVSPYAGMTSLQSVKAAVYSRNEGVEVTAELLEAHPLMDQWLKEMIANRIVRVFRIGKKPKCEFYPPDSKQQCSFYAEGCRACVGDLKGAYIYQQPKLLSLGDRATHKRMVPAAPRSVAASSVSAVSSGSTGSDSGAPRGDNGADPPLESYEPLTVDEDIKALWNSIKMPDMQTLLESYQISQPRPAVDPTLDRRSRKRKKPGSAPALKANRVNKVINSHLYSAETLNLEVTKNLQLEAAGDAARKARLQSQA
eukprot:Selendium_serpulae@DN2850_c0_g1_i3.p1